MFMKLLNVAGGLVLAWMGYAAGRSAPPKSASNPRGGSAEDGLHRAPQASKVENPVTAQRMKDSKNHVLIFNIPSEMSDADADQVTEYLTNMKEGGAFDSKILIIPEDIDMRGVTES